MAKIFRCVFTAWHCTYTTDTTVLLYCTRPFHFTCTMCQACHGTPRRIHKLAIQVEVPIWGRFDPDAERADLLN